MNKEPKIKFIKRANMWCVTYWEKDKIKQEWFHKNDKKETKNFIKELCQHQPQE